MVNLNKKTNNQKTNNQKTNNQKTNNQKTNNQNFLCLFNINQLIMKVKHLHRDYFFLFAIIITTLVLGYYLNTNVEGFVSGIKMPSIKLPEFKLPGINLPGVHMPSANRFYNSNMRKLRFIKEDFTSKAKDTFNDKMKNYGFDVRLK